MADNVTTSTIFDEEIARLEKRRTHVETERQKLLAGHITVTGPDGSSLMNINLGVLSATTSDQKTVERNLRQILLENPLVPVLDNSFKKTRELREELASRGELPASSRSLSPLSRFIRANTRSNQVVRRKNQKVGKVFASPWLLVAGLAILLFWCGGPLLYAVSDGATGGKPLPPGTAVPAPAFSPAGTAVTPLNKEITSTPKAHRPGIESVNLAGKVSLLAYPLNVQTEPLGENGAVTPTPTPAMVGNPPGSAGGFNGPHGAFMAPSRMTVPALGLDNPVERAISQDSSNGDEAVISWPRPGEVVQTGAYPGEIGNMLIMGNQKDLGGLRRVQQNDEVVVYDRKGNSFIYRFVAFGADSQTEREVDPSSPEDAWVFDHTDEAILTILITYPQPMPAVDPNQTGNNQVTPRDDYLVQKKLAYRAVLAMYAPAPTVAVGTPVAVPDAAWQTVAAPRTQPTQIPEPIVTPITGPIQSISGAVPTVTPAVNQITPTPQPGSIIPGGLPNTGAGGGGTEGAERDLPPVPTTIIRQPEKSQVCQSSRSFSRRRF